MTLQHDDDDDLRATITAAFNGQSDDDESEKSEAKEAVPKEEPKESADESTKANAEAESGKDEPAKEESPDEDGKPKSESPVEPPARWTKEEKEEFATFDPAVQKILLQRNKGLESSYTRKMTEIAQERQRYNTIEQILAPRRETWQRAGMDDNAALQSIMSYWDVASADPERFIDLFAQERGIDLANKYAPSAEEILAMMSSDGDESEIGTSPAKIYPAIQAQMEALAKQQQEIQQTVQQYGNHMQSQQHAEIQARTQAAQAELQNFASATNADGQPLYPFLEDVRQDMAGLMQSGLADNLQDAYEKATRLNPQTFSKMQESQEIARRQADEAKRREEAARAKRAGASVSASASSSGVPAEPDEENMSLRDMISAQFARANATGRV